MPDRARTFACFIGVAFILVGAGCDSVSSVSGEVPLPAKLSARDIIAFQRAVVLDVWDRGRGPRLRAVDAWSHSAPDLEAATENSHSVGKGDPAAREFNRLSVSYAAPQSPNVQMETDGTRILYAYSAIPGRTPAETVSIIRKMSECAALRAYRTTYELCQDATCRTMGLVNKLPPCGTWASKGVIE